MLYNFAVKANFIPDMAMAVAAGAQGTTQRRLLHKCVADLIDTGW